MTTLLTPSATYKPFYFPSFVEKTVEHESMHWVETEADLREDVRQWKDGSITIEEKSHITSILRLFTHSDHVVENSYIDYFLPFFKNNEVRMALLSIASRESTHERAYALLNDTLGFPDSEYIAFLDIPEMKEKADFMVSGFGNDSYKEMATSLAQTVCNEGLSLFSSFAMLLNYQRFGKMKGMCEIVEWSLKDEAHHCETMTMLFRYFVEEHPRIINDELKASIYSMFEKAVELEDAIIDVAFKDYSIKGLDKKDVKRYIRYIANRRLTGLGLKEIFTEKENPLDWLDWVVSGVDHKNFFEGRVTGYTVGGMSGEDYGDYTKLFQGKGA